MRAYIGVKPILSRDLYLKSESCDIFSDREDLPGTNSQELNINFSEVYGFLLLFPPFFSRM